MVGEMIQTKAKEFLQKMYGDANFEYNFSIGWLEWFKARHEIKYYKRFGESDSVVMKNIEDALPQIRVKLEIFYWKDIYNMAETNLFYHLQAYHSLATKQLEGRKKDKERLNVVVCCNRDGSDKVPFWVIGKPCARHGLDCFGSCGPTWVVHTGVWDFGPSRMITQPMPIWAVWATRANHIGV
ncbi:hypothetical protein J1N35_015202 [Gossypium stocksii]|uniref:HTH CENPB-type domain-containing protein n=1 Tax=Gossypium stocksii TaxID=47602 RepID=A0A9D3VXW5_9ROSI|nr:hypothetical protein J1N35_015202 [Gossypium stocksii]